MAQGSVGRDSYELEKTPMRLVVSANGVCKELVIGADIDLCPNEHKYLWVNHINSLISFDLCSHNRHTLIADNMNRSAA
jgi:hypothetical protein